MTASLSLSDAVEQYIALLQQQNKSKATLYTYGMDLKQVLAFFGSDRLVHSITLPQVGKFYRSPALLKLPNGNDRAEQTVRKTVRVFSKLMTWLFEQGHIETLPLPKHRPEILQRSSMAPEDTPLESPDPDVV